MDRPVAYHGGAETIFRRAESAAFFGREIGLMYVHAHLRYAEAMAMLGEPEALWRGARARQSDRRGRMPPMTPLSNAGQRAADKVIRIAGTLVPESGGPLFGAWCIADTDLAMMLWRLSRTGYPLPAKLRAFADAQWERPSVREFVAKPRPGTFVPY